MSTLPCSRQHGADLILEIPGDGDPWVAVQFSTAFSLERDPGVLGSSPTPGSLHGACFSLCLGLCLSFSVSLMNK